ncbi:protein transport protein sec24 [Hordeum vulgare]|nr:protein transport protein sec24 [Hordeum vulgare]
MPIWLQIHKLPDGYCRHELIVKLLRSAGEVLETRINDPPGRVRQDWDGNRNGKKSNVDLSIPKPTASKEGGLGEGDLKDTASSPLKPSQTIDMDLDKTSHKRLNMKEGLSWPLPNRVDIPCTGSEWLLHLLAKSHEHIRSRIIMVLWRIWHLRNELMHGKTIPPVDTSRSFLTSYYNTYQQISLSVEEILKGKTPVLDMRHEADPQSVPKRKLVWPRPAEHEVPLLVDGSFHAVDGSTGSGMILRDSTGAVIFASYRKLFHCNDALEAELQAIKEGLKLATEHSQATIILQSDCVEALKMIADASSNRSAY